MGAVRDAAPLDDVAESEVGRSSAGFMFMLMFACWPGFFLYEGTTP